MKTLTTLGVLIFCMTAAAAPIAKSTPVKSEDFRCEKMLSTALVDFKSALIENCDLNRPFSSSLSRVLNEDTFLYCCHKK